MSWLSALHGDARDWTHGRSPWARAALLAYLAYACVRHAQSGIGGAYSSWFAGLTLAFHELGHVVLAPAGETAMLLGGSGAQLVVPMLAAAHLLATQRDWFGASVCGAWLSTSAFELATYIDDANRGNLPLVGLGDDVHHDWDTLLTGWHLLNHAQALAFAVDLFARAIAAGSILFGGWLVLEMLRGERVAQ